MSRIIAFFPLTECLPSTTMEPLEQHMQPMLASPPNLEVQMDELRNLAVGVAQRILAAGTESERYELGVESTQSPSVENLVELAKQLLTGVGDQGKDRGGAGRIPYKP